MKDILLLFFEALDLHGFPCNYITEQVFCRLLRLRLLKFQNVHSSLINHRKPCLFSSSPAKRFSVWGKLDFLKIRLPSLVVTLGALVCHHSSSPCLPPGYSPNVMFYLVLPICLAVFSPLLISFFFLVSVLELQFLNESPSFFSVFTNTEAPVCNHPLHLDKFIHSFQPQFRNQVFLDSSSSSLYSNMGMASSILLPQNSNMFPVLMLTPAALLLAHLPCLSVSPTRLQRNYLVVPLFHVVFLSLTWHSARYKIDILLKWIPKVLHFNSKGFMYQEIWGSMKL